MIDDSHSTRSTSSKKGFPYVVEIQTNGITLCRNTIIVNITLNLYLTVAIYPVLNPAISGYLRSVVMIVWVTPIWRLERTQ